MKLANLMIPFPEVKHFAQSVRIFFLIIRKFFLILGFCCVCPCCLFCTIKRSL